VGGFERERNLTSMAAFAFGLLKAKAVIKTNANAVMDVVMHE
jgi:hypothetical protein